MSSGFLESNSKPRREKSSFGANVHRGKEMSCSVWQSEKTNWMEFCICLKGRSHPVLTALLFCLLISPEGSLQLLIIRWSPCHPLHSWVFPHPALPRTAVHLWFAASRTASLVDPLGLVPLWQLWHPETAAIIMVWTMQWAHPMLQLPAARLTAWVGTNLSPLRSPPTPLHHPSASCLWPRPAGPPKRRSWQAAWSRRSWPESASSLPVSLLAHHTNRPVSWIWARARQLAAKSPTSLQRPNHPWSLPLLCPLMEQSLQVQESRESAIWIAGLPSTYLLKLHSWRIGAPLWMAPKHYRPTAFLMRRPRDARIRPPTVGHWRPNTLPLPCFPLPRLTWVTLSEGRSQLSPWALKRSRTQWR